MDMKSGIFAALALSSACALVACNEEQAAAPKPPGTAASLQATNGRLALPPVKGNPGAVYFNLTNTGKAEVAVRGADVEGAQSAMMHLTEAGSMTDLPAQSVKAGETVRFAPGGRHVMAMGLADMLRAGGSTKVTLHLGTGDKIVFPAEIVAAGDAR
jgi:copper(I)-binding protein